MKHLQTRISAFKPILLVLAILLALPVFATRDNSIMQVTFLDVHQGDCIIVRTAEKTIMIDAGDDNRNVAHAYIIPYLKKEGVKTIDQAIISHPHRDHFGGFIELVKHFKFGEFLYSNDSSVVAEEGSSYTNDARYYGQLMDAIKAKKIPYRRAKAGELLNWGRGVKAEVLFTDDGSFGDISKSNVNEMSMIIKATAGKISYLFTGDAEKKAETAAIERAGRKLSSTVLKSGHHGSRTSSNHNFMDMVQPKYGVISAGKGNSFGHPTKAVLDIYDYYKMSVFRTDNDGTVESFTDGNTVVFETNNSPIKIKSQPKIISLTANSATIQWTTNRDATSRVECRLANSKTSNHKKAIENSVKVHTVTLTGLRPNTEYVFTAISTDPRENTKMAKANGKFKTKAGDGTPLPKVEKMKVNTPNVFMKTSFGIVIPVRNPASQPSAATTLELYHSAISPSNLIKKVNYGKIDGNKVITKTESTIIDWLGTVEIIAVLKQGSTIIDTGSLNVNVKPKIILVDCAHGNKDYFTGRFAGMKMDLFQNLGFQMKSQSKAFTEASLKDIFTVVIPSPTKDFTAAEIAAFKKYLSTGGTMLIYSMSDYRNLSKPQYLNKILKAGGSKIRFNDDQICDPDNNIGPPWRFFVTNFPSPKITGSKVKKLLLSSASTLLNDQDKPLRSSATVSVLATGYANSYSLDSDKKDDAPFLYSPSTTKILAPFAAVEDLGSGRVACVAERLYQDNYYSNPAGLSTVDFNRSIVAWLTEGRTKTIGSIVRSIVALESERNLELKADRYEFLSDSLIQKIRSNGHDTISSYQEANHEISGHSGELLDSLKKKLNDAYRFDRFHNRR